MQIHRPTPTCARIQSVTISCNHCGGEMRLALLAPHKRRLEALTYVCGQCEREETFLALKK
ncbi:MAG TPA: hypothetical protein VKY22_25180 [Bradyrhizobium sp.]|nr:hypothetical protein [Bradyrhizobium sp.]